MVARHATRYRLRGRRSAAQRCQETQAITLESVGQAILPRRRARVLHWLRYAAIALAGLVLLGALGLALVVGAWLFARWRWPGRRWRWWTKAAIALVAAFASAMLGLLVSSSVHATRLPDAASAGRCTLSPRLVKENMADLFNRVSRTYGASEPIHLVRVGPAVDNTILVMIPGQITNHTLAAIKVGLGVTGDKKADAVNAMITQFQQAHGLLKGSWVIIAGHSYGGMIAQLLANASHPNYHIAAVVTWGTPTISQHANGVAYQQYFSHYDVVPMFSTYELVWPVSLGGLVGGFGDMVAMQASPTLKGLHTGETFVPDMGQYWWPGNWIHTNGTWNDAHDGYGDSAWLGTQTLAFHRGSSTCVLMSKPPKG